MGLLWLFVSKHSSQVCDIKVVVFCAYACTCLSVLVHQKEKSVERICIQKGRSIRHERQSVQIYWQKWNLMFLIVFICVQSPETTNDCGGFLSLQWAFYIYRWSRCSSTEPTVLHHCVSTVAHIEQTKYWLKRGAFIFSCCLKATASIPTGLERKDICS